MQKKSAGSENIIGVGGSSKDSAAKVWCQLVVGLLRNFKNRILGGWLSLSVSGKALYIRIIGNVRSGSKGNVCCTLR